MSGSAGLGLQALCGPGAPVRVAPVAHGACVCPSASA
jgi:hypothetical protein